MDFTGKRVLVVGGSSGIGNATAQAFRAAGAAVTVWGTRPAAEDYRGEAGAACSKAAAGAGAKLLDNVRGAAEREGVHARL